MTRQEYTAKALEWLENHGVDLEEYAYIKALRRADRVPRSFNRVGSVEGTNWHILDKWEVA